MALASVNWNNEQLVTFTLNGEVQHVPSSVSGDLSLNRYIREYARLKGTKFMCREGGCGICVVSLEFTHPATGQERVVSVNSCMFPVLACHGLRVTTVEGIGSRKTGYSEIQTRLAHFYGTQCGYCTPGWVMSMYSFLKSNPKATMEEIEDSFSGNLCRCTGYRPILDAFKSFASDKCKKLEQKVADIEDLLRVCPRSGLSCNGKCNKNTLNRAPYDCVEKNSDFESGIEFLEVALASPSLKLELPGGTQWYKVASVDEIFEIFEMISGNYRLVGGNTSVGILKDQPHPDVFIDINRVSFLKAHSFYSNHLYVGANTTLNDAIELFKAVSEENPGDFAYTKQLARHIEKVANVPVRNVGTLAGNLSIKHAAKEFQSDIFLILETVGAQLSIRGDNEAISMISLPEYLETNMYKKVILQIVLPPLDSNQYIFRTFKITPRAQNALAYVNGGFLLKVNKQEQYSVLEVPRIVFGGINPSFIHAGQTERYLVGQKLLHVKTLQTALNILGKEVQPDYRLPDSRPQYRRRLALALLYRVVLSLNPSSVSKKFRSGGEDITRPLSSGRQEFEINDTDPPLYQPFPKLESLIQCSGEAEFIYDIQNVNNDLFAAFVTAKFGPAELDGLDPSEALKTPGVVAFYSAKDIPGINLFTPRSVDIPHDEQLFADKVILHAGQQVGLVVAVDQELADRAAELVRIVYKNRKLPVIDVRQVVKDNDTSRINLLKEIDATTKKDDIKKVIKGDIKVADQYHFTMETLSCLSVPTAEGLDVYCSTQFIQGVQEAISMVLNIPNNKINVTLRRVGGSFGLKLSRGNLVGAACSLAAYLLQRPVRMAVKLETMMEAIGKRHSIFSMYETGVNDDGVVQYMNIQIYIDGGSIYNDPVNQLIELNFNSVYDSSTWSLKTYIVRTDCAVNLWMRAPGTLNSITIAEHVMEHIAHVVCSDPQTVKERNFDTQYPIESLISSLKVKSDYEARKADVEEFNKAQVWKKRGISLVTKKYVLTTLTANHYATISVFSRDGTVAISHGGVEMGQGINTKVAQVCAAELDIPLEFVVVKPNNNFISPNNQGTGGSITTDCVAFATIQCCNELKKRLEPVRQKGIHAWADLVKAADLAGIDLKTSYMFSPATDKLEYLLFGAAVSEVEIDILTGEHKIIRVDIVEDAGKSMNPFIDIGQVEGAFVMGMGLFTSEAIIRDPNTGRVLTNRTLIYKIPGVKDIPVDFRVYFKKNSDNPLGVLGSKAVSEAPLVLSNTVLFAIRQAIASAHRDTGLSDVWLEMDTPFTAEKICLATGIDETKYLLFGDQSVSFTLNGEYHNVSSVSWNLSLNTYIREYALLKGTKFMCREGGCGICIVSLQFTHPVTGQERVVSVNSCMFPVLACHGLRVTTVEGIGSRKTGYNEIQTRLANFYGTQCGYCSPGWVMSMYSFLEANPKATMKEIEDSFSGNLCRCTGYRPILDAFKSFASDRTEELSQKVLDIEDLLKVCPNSGVACNKQCAKDKSKRTPFDCVPKNKKDSDIEFLEVALASKSLKLELQGGTQWYKVAYVDEIFEIFEMISGSYRLIGGNTSIGILKDQPPPDVFIDINGVAFLKAHSFYSNHLYVGANITLNDAIELFKAVSEENPGDFAYTKQLARHIEKVANVPVRNVGTLAGNLSIKHAARQFQSDIFLILETVGALVSVRGNNEAIDLLSLPQYLETDMYKKVILQIILPPLDSKVYTIRTFKIAPRAQNALAYVNGGFKFKVNKQDQYRVAEQPRIIFGGINPAFIHADQTERFLFGRRLLDINTLQAALNILGKEVQPDYRLPDSTPDYRRGLAQALLYRAVLSLNPNSVRAQFRSGGEDISRPLSSGRQEFDTNSSRPPLYQPFPKLESLIQCSGEAEYIYDLPTVGNDLYAALIICKKGPGQIKNIDTSEAIKIPGVVAIFTAKDIPGKNTISPKNDFILYEEELFASKEALFAGHQVGILVARTQELADIAAERVKIVYSKLKKPVLDVREVVQNKDVSRIVLRQEREATKPPGAVQKVIKGDFKMDTQYHFCMEAMTCVTVPTSEGLDVFCSTQWMQVVHETIALVLNLPQNKINMKLSKLGGGYGQKVTRANIVGGACSLAAYLLQRPVRMVVKLETMMEAIGTRWPCLVQYEAGVNNEGVIQYMTTRVYEDAGSSFNDFVVDFTVLAYTNVYDPSTWSTKMYDVRTDKPCSAWARAPGTFEGVAMAEHILEHIAHEVNKDPLSVRMNNLDKQYPIEKMVSVLKEKSDYTSRKVAVDDFNKRNVWKKKGLSIVPMRFQLDTFSNYNVIISVYRNDGTVALAHGGVEVGQGINTKAAQVCASALGIPLEDVVIKPTNNLTSPNDGFTGGSYTSESVCYAVEQCCIELNKRLEPIRNQLVAPTWLDVIQAAYTAQIDLTVTHMFSPKVEKTFSYQIFGIIIMEVEVDIMTGEHKISRVDIMEDAGNSLNPFIDIGQLEGAFMMGLGYFTSEKLIRDPDTGRTLTNRTLKYEIPGAKDIPVDFRVYFLKNSDNPLGILRSKAVGEPPICLSVSVLFAIRQALRSARKDVGLPDEWLKMDAPFTAENIFLSSGIDEKKYSL